MKLWLISQTIVDGYDTYSDAVVAAPDEATAKTIHPGHNWDDKTKILTIPVPDNEWGNDNSTWANDPADVTAEFIGEAKEGTPMSVICASFHAG